MRLTGLKKLDPTAHWEVKRGTIQQAIEYCKKDGDYYEFGTPPVEERSNANVYADCIAAAERGDMNYIKETHPGQFLRYKRTFDGLSKKVYEPLLEPRGTWLYGSPGAGKDTAVMNKYKPYVKPHNKWWDGYDAQPVVLMSDVDKSTANWCGHHLKIWADRYPFPGEVKGGTITIHPEKFFVTSNYHFSDLFEGEQLLKALERRFDVVDADTGAVIKRPKLVPNAKLEDLI